MSWTFNPSVQPTSHFCSVIQGSGTTALDNTGSVRVPIEISDSTGTLQVVEDYISVPGETASGRYYIIAGVNLVGVTEWNCAISEDGGSTYLKIESADRPNGGALMNLVDFQPGTDYRIILVVKGTGNIDDSNKGPDGASVVLFRISDAGAGGGV
jgi:hypothetical protein